MVYVTNSAKKKALAQQLSAAFAEVEGVERVLTPNDFPSLEALQERILAFERHYEAIAKPFEGKFTRQDPSRLLAKMKSVPAGSRVAA